MAESGTDLPVGSISESSDGSPAVAGREEYVAVNADHHTIGLDAGERRLHSAPAAADIHAVQGECQIPVAVGVEVAPQEFQSLIALVRSRPVGEQGVDVRLGLREVVACVGTA